MPTSDLDFAPSSACAHPNSESRLRTQADGRTAIYRQCLTCGQVLGGAIAKAQAPVTLPPFDDELAARYNREWSDQANAIREREREAERIKYAAYLRSDAWFVKREAVMERANHLCEGCRLKRAAQVHHLTYEHKYNELLFELVAVCEGCHQRCHGIST